MTETHDSGHGHGHDAAHDSGHDHDAGHGHGDGHDPAHGTAGQAKSRRSTGQAAGHASHASAAGGWSPAGLLRGAAAVAILAIVLLPFLFVIYRLSLFDASPHDDYARFLLHMLHLPGGEVPGSPYGYRGLAVLAAVPFFYALPELPLIAVPAGLSLDLVRATAALALLSYLCLVGTLYATYRLARDRAGQHAASALLATALMFVLLWYTDFLALDPLAMLLTMLGLYLLPHRQGFTLLLLATPVINEQIAIIFALWLTLRCVSSQADREVLGLQWATAIAALLVYAALVTMVQLPGGGAPFDSGSYVATLRDHLATQATGRALILNLLPIVLLLSLGLIGHFGWPRRQSSRPRWDGLFRRVDLVMIPVMAVVALTQFSESGRIVLHAAPLFVVPAGAVLLHRLAGKPAGGVNPA